MKKLLTIAIICFVCLNAFAQKEQPPAGGQPKPFVFPKAETYELKNGMKVTLVQYGSVPKVAFQLNVRTGSLNEKKEKRWISDAVATMLKDGTKTRSAEDIARETAEMGGGIFSGAGNDTTSIGGEVLSEFDVRFLNLMADVVLNPKFANDDLEKYRANRLRALAVARTQPGNVAWEQFRKVIFADHTYAEMNPTDETVKSYTIEDVRNYYNENYGAMRAHLYIVGKFDTAAIKSAIEKSFGGWKHGAEPIRDVPTIKAKRSMMVIDRPDAPQSTIYLGMPAPSPSDADFIKFTVMDTILGGAFASRITANIRENKGYTYSPGSFIWNRFKTGYWVEAADVTTQFTGASVKEILYEIDRMRKEPLSEAELQGIKNYMVGIYVLQNSTRNGVIGQLENVNYNELDKNYIDTYVQKIVAVTPKDVQEMAQKYLQEDKMTIVVVGDKAKITEQLKPYEK